MFDVRTCKDTNRHTPTTASRVLFVPKRRAKNEKRCPSSSRWSKDRLGGCQSMQTDADAKKRRTAASHDILDLFVRELIKLAFTGLYP